LRFSNFVLERWLSPPVKGSQPPPCYRFSLTLTDEDKALMFGGFVGWSLTSEAHVLHLSTMVCLSYKMMKLIF